MARLIELLACDLPDALFRAVIFGFRLADGGMGPIVYAWTRLLPLLSGTYSTIAVDLSGQEWSGKCRDGRGAQTAAGRTSGLPKSPRVDRNFNIDLDCGSITPTRIDTRRIWMASLSTAISPRAGDVALRYLVLLVLFDISLIAFSQIALWLPGKHGLN